VGVPDASAGAAVLGDTNEHLIDTYVAIQDNVEEVIRVLQGHRYDPAIFQKMRETDPESLSLHERAAWFIYLNRTCYNGLW
jgi:DNA adenine methylase